MVLITTVVTLAIRCPECGVLEFHNLSRFSLSGKGKFASHCSCGAFLLGIVNRSPGIYWLQIPCIFCETKHLLELSGTRLWGKETIHLNCPQSGLELGFIGEEKRVKELAESLDSGLQSLIDELGYDEYFNNPEVMHQVMESLEEIADNGDLSCQCGNTRIEVDVFLDRLELHCPECDSINIVYAETEEDLKVIQQVDAIELTQHGFKCLDSFSNNPKHTKKTRRKRNKHS